MAEIREQTMENLKKMIEEVEKQQEIDHKRLQSESEKLKNDIKETNDLNELWIRTRIRLDEHICLSREKHEKQMEYLKNLLENLEKSIETRQKSVAEQIVQGESARREVSDLKAQWNRLRYKFDEEAKQKPNTCALKEKCAYHREKHRASK